jgi:hypothetical protein
VAAIVIRLLPHPWNVTPLGALFLFSGVPFRRKRDSLLIPLGALLLSDYAVIHFTYGRHYAWLSPYSWTGFLLVGLLGWTLRRHLTVARGWRFLGGSVAFFLVSNCGVWMGWKVYPPTFHGLVECYTATLPFSRNHVVGDLAYTGAMSGAWAWTHHRRLATANGTR